MLAPRIESIEVCRISWWGAVLMDAFTVLSEADRPGIGLE
jgi:hypothetical protein